MDLNHNLHQFNLEDTLVVSYVAHNLTSHKAFVDMGHLLFFHMDMSALSGISLDCKNLSFIKAEDTVIPFDKEENGLEYLLEYLPITFLLD